jgi:hypothetical protein
MVSRSNSKIILNSTTAPARAAMAPKCASLASEQTSAYESKAQDTPAKVAK